jgi:hypothetical protein
MNMAALITSKDEIVSFFRGDVSSLDVNDLLQRPVKDLLGVSDEDAAALKKLGGIETVFDLAASGVFKAAANISDAARDPSKSIFRTGKVPADLLNPDSRNVALVDMPSKPISLLAGVPPVDANGISAALNVTNVLDFARYPPYKAATKILQYLLFPGSSINDGETPEDLLPVSGEYPIEKVQYSTLLMGEIPQPAGADALKDINADTFQPIDIKSLTDLGGFKRVALGALLTFTQSWFAEAVTLGHLLHSTTLAPGESTRVAVIDWSRRSAAGETEVITEADALVSNTDHSRAISEVTSAVANEAQTGFSASNTSSTTTASASSESFDISAPLGGFFGGASGGGGASQSRSDSAASSSGFSTTTGHRDVTSTMLQNVNDRTHQNASSSRNRRASVVKEVSQNEHEAVSTRVIANYNHMHALTVQYYEVVQIFRVEVRLAKAEKVVYIPFSMPDFDDADTIRRFQGALRSAALTYDAFQTLTSMDTIELQPELTTTFASFGSPLTAVYKEALLTRSSLTAGTIRTPRPAALTLGVRTSDSPASSTQHIAGDDMHSSMATDPTSAPGASRTVSAEALARETLAVSRPFKFRDALPIVSQANNYLWNKNRLTDLASLMKLPLLRNTSNALQLPTDTIVEGAVVTGSTLSLKVVLYTAGFPDGITDFGADLADSQIAMRDVQRISVRGSSSTSDVNVTANLTLNRNGVIFPLELPEVTLLKNSTETIIVKVNAGAVSQDLKAHLKANRLHYGQAILKSLDAMQLSSLLSGFGYKLGKKLVPVSEVVNPVPIRYVGNYLAFKTNIDGDSTDDPDWKTFMETVKINVGNSKNDTIPLGTGGVFAEAVLGRSNCAERLDATRFWDWKDSPPPLLPTDIAAINTESRATAEDTKPGQLSAPIINMTAPTSLPDPAGTAAILAAIQNGNMFRDQSGLAATIGLTQAALQATQAGAAAAGQQAGQNLANQLAATTERQKTAAAMITDLAKTAASVYTGVPMGGSSGGGGSGKSGSQQGALINYFDKMKGQGSATDAGGASTGRSGPVTGGSSGSGASGGGGGSSTSTGGGRGSSGGGTAGTSFGSAAGFSQNPAAREAIGDRSNFFGTLLDKVDGVLGMGDDTVAERALENRKAWPNLDPNLVLTRIRTLKGNPDMMDQGGFGLCTGAGFFHTIIQTNPDEFEKFANALYGGGIGFLGNLKVNPGSDLRNANYNEIMARLDKKFSPPPQADWMIMSAIRDSENWILDFEGDFTETMAMETSLHELRDWFDQTGWYRNLQYDDNPTLDELRALPGGPPNAGNFVLLHIRVQLLAPDFSTAANDKRGHIITLSSRIHIDEANNKASFEYWTWARAPRTLQTTVTSLRENVIMFLSLKKR